MSTSPLDQSLHGFFDAVASPESAPAGGAVTATTLAMAAGLVAMAARVSPRHLPEAGETATHADRLRERAAALAQQDTRAYAQVLAAYRIPRQPDPARRRERIRAALHHAAEVPTEMARTAAEIAEAGTRLVRAGNPNLAGDATTAVLLAHACARSAAELVRINTDTGDLDPDLASQAHHHSTRTGRRAWQVGGGAAGCNSTSDEQGGS